MRAAIAAAQRWASAASVVAVQGVVIELLLAQWFASAALAVPPAAHGP